MNRDAGQRVRQALRCLIFTQSAESMHRQPSKQYNYANTCPKTKYEKREKFEGCHNGYERSHDQSGKVNIALLRSFENANREPVFLRKEAQTLSIPEIFLAFLGVFCNSESSKVPWITRDSLQRFWHSCCSERTRRCPKWK